MAVAAALLTLILFFTGFHDDVEGIESGLGKILSGVGSLAISIAFLALAMRDKRANTPIDASWGYGSALWTGVLTDSSPCSSAQCSRTSTSDLSTRG